MGDRRSRVLPPYRRGARGSNDRRRKRRFAQR